MFIRGANPVWSFVDLTGHQLDDSYWMFVLENEIPYSAASVYHEPDGTPWTNPINFLANGTLPVDIYWDAGTSDIPNAYRIEIRQGDTQADPLIYLIENYIPGDNGGDIIPTDIIFSTDNQMSNAQFPVVNFSSPYSLTSSVDIDVDIGPEWLLSLTTISTGTITLTRVGLNSLTPNDTNAPFALRINGSGWSSVTLKQRFDQNGMLWANQTVSSSITAMTNLPGALIRAVMVDSQGHQLGEVLDQKTLTGTFVEYRGHDLFPDSLNTAVPPATWIEYRLQLPTTLDLFVTSFQLVASNKPNLEFSYEQDSIERQIDHTFHYFEPQLAYKQIPSILTGWDFTVNPAQFGVVQTITNGNPAYIWDQTIAKSRVGNVAVSRSNSAGGITFTNSQPSESMYLMQYLTDGEAIKTKSSVLSVNIDGYSPGKTNVQARVYLFVANTAGSIPFLSMGSGAIGNLNADGTFTQTDTDWTEIPLLPGFSRTKNLNSSRVDIDFVGFDGTSVGGVSTSTQLFCAIVTFFIPTVSTFMTMNSISLVQGYIPSRTAPMTWAQTLANCQYYYETSYANLAEFLSTPANNAVVLAQSSQVFITFSGVTPLRQVFGCTESGGVVFNTPKITAPDMTFYAADGTVNYITGDLYWFLLTVKNKIALKILATQWDLTAEQRGFYLIPRTGFTIGITGVDPDIQLYNSADIQFHYEADARLGVV
jgi:hypothetical protein